MQEPDLENIEIYCGDGHHPVRMTLVKTLDVFKKAIYKCTVCGKEKEAIWRSFTKQLKIQDR
jgi:hypothetical protein